jgi:hypothetical protein
MLAKASSAGDGGRPQITCSNLESVRVRGSIAGTVRREFDRYRPVGSHGDSARTFRRAFIVRSSRPRRLAPPGHEEEG